MVIQRLKHLLVVIGLWIARLGGWKPPSHALLTLIEPIVTELERKSAPGTSGAYKRHMALALAHKKYPKLSTRELNMAIEIVVQKCL